MSLIYEAIPAILADVEAIGKNRQNKQQGFAFRGIDDVYNVLHPLLAKHKVFPACEVTDVQRSERETKNGGTMFCVTLKAKYTLYAADGSSVCTEAAGEGMDMADKATNKALSSCYKYAMFQLLCIPTEAVDPDSETPEPVKARTTERPAVKHAQAVAAEHGMMTAEQLERRKRDDKWVADVTESISKAADYPALLAISDLIQEQNGYVKGQLRAVYSTRAKELKEPAMAGVG